MANQKPKLDDPTTYAAFAWHRYWQLMRWMGLVAFVCVVAALTFLWQRNDGLPIHFIIATAGGIGFSVMLMAVLMGLVFFSSGTGYDEVVEDRLKEKWPDDRWQGK